MTDIENNQATSDVPNNTEICSRSGFRLYPGELMRDGYGELMRSRSVDGIHPQDNIRAGRSAPQRGAIRPEQDDTFIATSIAPEDL